MSFVDRVRRGTRLLPVLLTGTAVLVSAGCGRQESPPLPPRTAVPDTPALPFTDVTEASGVRFIHRSGARGEKWLPETNIGGLAFLDLDGDGDPDLAAVSGGERADPRHESAEPTLRLWLNDGRGRFSEATDAISPPFRGYGMSLAVGDFDGDGRDDLYVAALGADRLYRNVDGRRLVWARDALGPPDSVEALTIAATFLDAEPDGDLDLLVTNYATWTPARDARTNDQIVGLARTYAGPGFFASHAPQYFENLGQGRLRERARDLGLAVTHPGTGRLAGKPLGLLPIDLDGDGVPEIVVANDKQPNFTLKRGTDGRYTEGAIQLGLAYNSLGESTAAMGIDAAWLGPERELHIAMGNFSGEMMSLYRQDPTTRQFFDVAPVTGVGAATRLDTTFGVLFADLDLDGHPDLVQANGHVEPEIARAQPSVSYAQRPRVLWQCATGCATRFVDVPTGRLGDMVRPLAGRGLAAADIDGDGDLDLAFSEVDGPLRLYRNDQATGHRSLRVQLEGPPGNRRGIGALVDVVACGHPQRQLILHNRGYASASEPVATFGLGRCTAPARVTVIWPGGAQTTVEGIATSTVRVSR